MSWKMLCICDKCGKMNLNKGSWLHIPEGWTRIDDNDINLVVHLCDDTSCNVPTKPMTPKYISELNKLSNLTINE